MASGYGWYSDEEEKFFIGYQWIFSISLVTKSTSRSVSHNNKKFQLKVYNLIPQKNIEYHFRKIQST